MADEYRILSDVLKEFGDVDDMMNLVSRIDVHGLLGNPNKTIIILLIVLILLLKKKNQNGVS